MQTIEPQCEGYRERKVYVIERCNNDKRMIKSCRGGKLLLICNISNWRFRQQESMKSLRE